MGRILDTAVRSASAAGARKVRHQYPPAFVVCVMARESAKSKDVSKTHRRENTYTVVKRSAIWRTKVTRGGHKIWR